MTELRVVEGDITTMTVDAIVNAANAGLRGGGGVDGAIHAAGGPAILEECRRLISARGPLHPGEAVLTGAGALTAQAVIHTVGPIWGDAPPDEQDGQLAACYESALLLCDAHEFESVAFPNVGTGVYGYPKPRAASVAVGAVRRYVDGPTRVGHVTFVCFDDENLRLYQALLEA